MRLISEGMNAHFSGNSYYQYLRFYRRLMQNTIDPLGETCKWVLESDKKAERLRTCEKLRTRGLDSIGIDKERRSYNDTKPKPGEVLNGAGGSKPLCRGAPERCIGEMGKASAFESGPFVSQLKKVMEQEFVYRNSLFVFIAGPRKENFDRMIYHMNRPGFRIVWCYYSDDSCVRFKTSTGYCYANGDYKNADGSLNRPVVEAFSYLMCCDAVTTRETRRTFQQLTKPMRLINRAHRNHRVRGKNKFDFIEFSLNEGETHLYSGSSSTTPVN